MDNCCLPSRPIAHALPFDKLAELFDGHPARFKRVVKEFCISTLHDLAAMDHAAALGMWSQVRTLAGRISNGCHCVHAASMADVFVTLSTSRDDGETRKVYLHLYSATRRTLVTTVMGQILD